jgi:hypothetical protein
MPLWRFCAIFPLEVVKRKETKMAEHIDDTVVFIEWVNQRERGVFDALSDTLRLRPNVPGALGRAVYHDSLVQLLGVAVVTYELYGPGHRMREYLEGYISEVNSILGEGTF